MVTARRRYLRGICGLGTAALGGLAGCNGDDRDDTDGSPTESETPTETATGSGETRPTGTGGPGVTVAAVDGDIDIPVEPSVAVSREAATEAHPPQLETTLTNTGDESVSVGEGRAVHFEYVNDDSDSLMLLPPGGDYPAEAGCWRLTEGVAVTEEYQTFEIGAGESSTRPVDLYGAPGEDACLPVGEYRFETTISIVSADAEPESSARWGFSILLE